MFNSNLILLNTYHILHSWSGGLLVERCIESTAFVACTGILSAIVLAELLQLLKTMMAETAVATVENIV